MQSLVRFATSMAVAFLFAGSATAQTTPATAQRALAPTMAITYQGTITEIDTANRILTTRGQDGRIASFEVPTTVSDVQLSSLMVGDVVLVTYSDAISFRRKAAGEPVVDTRDPATRLRIATVTVTAVDPVARTITFTGAKGRDYTRRVVSDTNAQLLRDVVVGDRVDVSWYETMQITKVSAQAAVPPPPAVPPVQDDFRHRFTISALIGWDNQFSGKMIKAGSGTLNGVPINLQETTFDDVYGRMGLFKIGIGYRTSPRAELTANLVISRSSSEPVVVGTVGTQNAPVAATFDDYNYWGLEFGQRFYFARTRFTPFLGYYAGINQFDAINADFRAPAVGTQPSLDIQDGQFFDSSWAFSFGPTGGVLIGLGPFEVMGQIELRYMGGLSDVDPLSEAGLKDINSESSRWSIPILVGARIRF